VLRRDRLDDELRQEVDTHLALIEDEELANGAGAERAGMRAYASEVRSRTASARSTT